MKKYLSILLICLCVLLVSCGQGNPKDFDIKLSSADGEDLAESIEELLEKLEEEPITGNASWYNFSCSGYDKRESEQEDYEYTYDTKYAIKGSVYVGKTKWDTKLHVSGSFTSVHTTDEETVKTTASIDIVWLEGTGYYKSVTKETSDESTSKETEYYRFYDFDEALDFYNSELIEYIFNVEELFEEIMYLAEKSEIESEYEECEVFNDKNKYAFDYSFENKNGSNESSRESKLQFEYIPEKNLVKSIDLYHKSSSENEDVITEQAYSVKVDKALFGIIIKPLNHAEYEGE